MRPLLRTFTKKDNSHTIILGVYVIIFGLGRFDLSSIAAEIC